MLGDNLIKFGAPPAGATPKLNFSTAQHSKLKTIKKAKNKRLKCKSHFDQKIFK